MKAFDLELTEAAYRQFSTKRFPLPTEEQVADLEQRIGVSFPEDFRLYLLKYNGGYFNESDIFSTAEECPRDCLVFLNGIGATEHAELASDSDLAIFDDNDPPEVVPIGYTVMGNLILLLTHPEGRGSIVLKKAYSDEYFILAEGIEGFFGLLRTPSDN